MSKNVSYLSAYGFTGQKCPQVEFFFLKANTNCTEMEYVVRILWGHAVILKSVRIEEHLTIFLTVFPLNSQISPKLERAIDSTVIDKHGFLLSQKEPTSNACKSISNLLSHPKGADSGGEMQRLRRM